MLQNLMSIMAAIVSSSGRINVGPKHTPRFATVIRFLLLFSDTLEKINTHENYHTLAKLQKNKEISGTF